MSNKKKEMSEAAQLRRKILGLRIKYWTKKSGSLLSDVAKTWEVTPQHVSRVTRGEIDLNARYLSSFVSHYMKVEEPFNRLLIPTNFSVKTLKGILERDKAAFKALRKK